MKRRIAILPARGGSRRIPNKNIRDFCGKPMIAYALDAAQKSGLFECIHVSTDSRNISEKVAELGFKIDFMRPPDLADDHTPIVPVLKYVVEQYRERECFFDEVVLIMPCSPLIDSDDLIGASALMEKFESRKQVLAVSSYPVPVEWAFHRSDNGILTPMQPGKFSIRSQDLGDKYFDVGMFCFFPENKILMAEGAGDDEAFVGYEVSKSKAVDIDNEDDWQFAEAIYRGMHSDY